MSSYLLGSDTRFVHEQPATPTGDIAPRAMRRQNIVIAAVGIVVNTELYSTELYGQSTPLSVRDMFAAKVHKTVVDGENPAQRIVDPVPVALERVAAHTEQSVVVDVASASSPMSRVELARLSVADIHNTAAQLAQSGMVQEDLGLTA